MKTLTLSNKTLLTAFAFVFAALTATTVSAKKVLVTTNTNWSDLKGGSNSDGTPNKLDTVIVHGTTGSSPVILTIDRNAEAKYLQLGQVSTPRTGEINILDGRTFLVWGLMDAQLPNNGKDNIVRFASTTSKMEVLNFVGEYYVTIPSTQKVTKNAALPVEFISFNAAKRNNIVSLDFATAWEVNNRGFEVERSTNGVYWSNIGFVAGNGNSTQVLNYTFTTSLAGINTPVVYYRLKQVDFNGQFEYSQVRTIRLSGAVAKAESIYPNPAMNKVSISLGNVAAGETVLVSIMDMTGKVIMTERQMAAEGNSAIDMNVENLKKGNYIVNVSSANVNFNSKLVKL